jgi:hypothetical protein
VFGEAFIEEKRVARAKPPPRPSSEVFDKARFALRDMGFGKREVELVLRKLQLEHAEFALDPLLRAALNALTPER